MELNRFAASSGSRPDIDGLFLFIIAVRLIVVVGGFLRAPAPSSWDSAAVRFHPARVPGRRSPQMTSTRQAHLAGLDGLGNAATADRRCRDSCRARSWHFQTLFDALRDADLAPRASVIFHGAHFAHVHAHRIGGASELRVQVGECRRRLFHGFLIGSRGRVGQQQRLGVSGAFSYTGMPMSLIMLTMSSICSGSTISLGK